MFSGYLKWTGHKDYSEYKLKIPNQEVMYFYRNTVAKTLKDKNIQLDNMLELLINEEIEDFIMV